MATPSDVGARCPAAGSIRQALNRAITLVGREFSLESSCQVRFRGSNCSALRAEWSSRKATLLCGVPERTSRTLSQMLKSCDRFFDIECAPCDRVLAAEARAQWQRDVAADPGFDPATPASWSDDPLGELARRVRKIVGTQWGQRMSEYRAAALVPDQNGCMETPRGVGGTLATAPCEYSPDRYGLRVGVAKTKGKFRVVTMQSAAVKEVLGPVHECLYDFLSRRKWLVRGDLTKEHISFVLDDREPASDEVFVSGDYKAATNNIYLEAVTAIVEVLAECPFLSPEERETLRGSFCAESLHWVSRNGRGHPIRRGSMMGNLVSFPVLCLLNKACFDIVSSLRRKRTGVKRYRRPIINGDDIAFAGNAETYDDWVRVTSHYGLVVNAEKTGRSERFIELNSRSFDVAKRRFLRKPVLSALQPLRDPSCLLTRLWDGLRTLSPGSFRWMVIMLRHDIIRRGVCLSGIPSRLRRVLVKERWFRSALLNEPRVEETGVKRAWPHVLKDVRPPDHFIPVFDAASRSLLRRGVRRVRGLKVKPWSCVLQKGPLEAPIPRGRFSFRSEWKWCWPVPLWNWWERLRLPLQPLGQEDRDWEVDHPSLSVKISTEVWFPGVPPPLSVLFSALRPDGVNWI